MDSKEMGLVLAQKLVDLDDLHYGFWEEGVEVSIEKFFQAQEKYSDILFAKIEELLSFDKKTKILDVGCGVGENIRKLCNKGYHVDGIVPSKWMMEVCKKKTNSNIYPCKFEDFVDLETDNTYDLVFFSESFQYVDMEKSFDILDKILKPSGKVLIFDFFNRDNIEGKSPLGGGHLISRFYDVSQKSEYKIIDDNDYTKNLSPNLDLVNNILMKRIIPSVGVLDEFLSKNYNKLYRLFKFIYRKKINKFKFKYSNDRNAQNFEKYKIYKMIVLSKEDS